MKGKGEYLYSAFCTKVHTKRWEALRQCIPPPRHVCRGCMSWPVMQWRHSCYGDACPALQRRIAQSLDTTFRISQ